MPKTKPDPLDKVRDGLLEKLKETIFAYPKPESHDEAVAHLEAMASVFVSAYSSIFELPNTVQVKDILLDGMARGLQEAVKTVVQMN